MTTRTLTKVLAGIQDLVLGFGTVAQSRNGIAVTLHKVDVPTAVATSVEVAALDPAENHRARLYFTDYFVEYIYNATTAAASSSINSTFTGATGEWRVLNPVLVSPDGTKYELSVANGGTLSISAA